MKKPPKASKPEASQARSPSPDRVRSWRGSAGPGGFPRVDSFIAEQGVLTRSQLKARDAEILVNGRGAKASRPLLEGDSVEVRWLAEEPDILEAEQLDLSIIYEDSRVVVVDKAQGMVTHPGAGNRHGTLANAALALVARDRAQAALPGGGKSASPERDRATRGGIVHRLDKDTSGLIIVAKDLEAQVFLASQFKERKTRKEYIAIVRGRLDPPAGRIADRLGRDRRNRKKFCRVAEGGKTAVTDYRVLCQWSSKSSSGGDAYSLVLLRPKTGRTHQLRVHMAGLGNPILGDPLYGKKDPRFPEATLMLHARRLKLVLPEEAEARCFAAPIPERFEKLSRSLDKIFGKPDKFRESE